MNDLLRPIISNYEDPRDYLKDMVGYLKATKRSFTVKAATKNLRRVSPALVSLWIAKRRTLTFDRVSEIAKALLLTPQEKSYLLDWVLRIETGHSTHESLKADSMAQEAKQGVSRSRKVPVYLLKDWMNVFVKDAFELEIVRKDPQAIYRVLSGIASAKRIDQSIQFLLKHGYLTKDDSGRITPDVALHVIEDSIPSEKIREFHKAILRNAVSAIDQFPVTERFANSLVLALNQDSFDMLKSMISEFASSIQRFAENTSLGERLYQVTVQLSPTGGASLEKNNEESKTYEK